MKPQLPHTPTTEEMVSMLKRMEPNWGTAFVMPIIRAVNAYDDMLTALKEISKGAGAFSRDPLEHATNTIEEMKEMAKEAIAKAQEV